MSDTDRIIMLLDGFAKTEAEAALAAYGGAGHEASRVVVAPVTDKVAVQNTAEAVEAVAAGTWPGGTPRTDVRHGALIAGADKAAAVALMRAFKSVLPADADPAFAMVTQTGRTWSVEEYLDHIRKEHDYMKNADPSMDPDMREVN